LHQAGFKESRGHTSKGREGNEREGGEEETIGEKEVEVWEGGRDGKGKWRGKGGKERGKGRGRTPLLFGQIEP